MGSLRDTFWELPLDTLSRSEWEALCDGCGMCCLHKLEDEDTGAIALTNVACRLLCTETAQCSDYRHRKAYVPECLQLTPRLLAQVEWLPPSCAYVLRRNDEPLPDWHYLISGDRNSIIAAGMSVAGRVISEDEAGPVEHHIVEWGEP